MVFSMKTNGRAIDGLSGVLFAVGSFQGIHTDRLGCIWVVRRRTAATSATKRFLTSCAGMGDKVPTAKLPIKAVSGGKDIISVDDASLWTDTETQAAWGALNVSWLLGLSLKPRIFERFRARLELRWTAAAVTQADGS